MLLLPLLLTRTMGGAMSGFNPETPITEAENWLLELVTRKDAPKPAPAANVAQNAVYVGAEGGTKYGLKALNDELEYLRTAPQGTRNDTLNRVAVKLFGLAHGGELDAQTVRRELEVAAREIGLEQSETLKTIESAWKAATPRTAPQMAGNMPGHPAATSQAAVDDGNGPLPLRRPPKAQEQYPDGCFFEYSQAVVDIAAYTQTAPSLVGSTVLAGLSLMTQALANVRTPRFRTPLSLFTLTVGETGDGKSTVENILFKPIREKERALREEYDSQRKDYEIKQAAFDRELKKLNGNTRASREEYESQLARLEETRPQAPAEPFLFTGDANIEGLYRNLRYGLPFIGIFVGDGGRLLGGTAFAKENVVKTISNLCELWSGNALDKMRCGEGASKLYDRRVCSSIMLQPILAREMFADPLLAGQGFLCRQLVSWPDALPKSPEQVEIESLPSVQMFYQACEALLSLPIRQAADGGGLIFDELTLSPDALDAYKKFFVYIEENRKPDAMYEPVNGYAKRAAEQALRIAGCLSMARNAAARVIDKPTMEAGIKLAEWYIDEILRVVLDDMASPEILQAEKLLQWLQDKRIKTTNVRQVQIYGPNSLREKAAILKTFKTLEDHGWLKPLPEGAVVLMGDKQTTARQAWAVVHGLQN